MRYVVVAAGGQVVYCQTRAEAVLVAREIRGRIYRPDWTEVVEGRGRRPD